MYAMHSGDASLLSVVASVAGSSGRRAMHRAIEPSLAPIGDETRSPTDSRESRALIDQTGKATIPRRDKPMWCGRVLERNLGEDLQDDTNAITLGQMLDGLSKLHHNIP